jgi:hypothetical protein
MFYKNKKTEKSQLISQKLQDKPGIVVNKEAAASPRDTKESTKAKSAMRSEGGKN